MHPQSAKRVSTITGMTPVNNKKVVVAGVTGFIGRVSSGATRLNPVL